MPTPFKRDQLANEVIDHTKVDPNADIRTSQLQDKDRIVMADDGTPFDVDISMAGKRITDLPAPVGANEPARKTDIDNIETDKNFYYVQNSAASVWTINHGLNKYPSASIFDSSGREVEGQIEYPSGNTIRITFSQPFAGKATLN